MIINALLNVLQKLQYHPTMAAKNVMQKLQNVKPAKIELIIVSAASMDCFPVMVSVSLTVQKIQ
jgi:hypothetical protein